MKIVEASVTRWQGTVLMFLMLAALGAASWVAIPRSESPIIPVPAYTVIVVYPGAPPADMEQLVVDKVEPRLAALDRVKTLVSVAKDGLAVTSVEFEADVDADRKAEEVQREINALRPSLPSGVARVEVQRASGSDVSVIQVALVSDAAPYAQLDSLARELRDRLKRVPGVKKADRWAAPQREVQVELDLERLAMHSLSPQHVLQAIGSDNASIPGGSVDAGARRFNLVPRGRYASLDDMRATVVGGSSAAVIRLQDVAHVRWGAADAVHIGRWNGQRAVFVTAAMQERFNIASVVGALWRTVDSVETTLPKGVSLQRGFDQASIVQRSLGRLGKDFAIALALILLTLLPLGGRAALIVMVSIPLSLAIDVTLLHWTGYSINQLTIVGFVIALGLLVDDSIVVVENITRFLREGHSRRDAAVMATKQIAVAVMGATATLVFAFVPLIFLPGLAGRFVRALPLAVVYAVLASLLVSFTIVPWLASLLLPRTQEATGNRFLRLLERGIQRTYAPVLHRALASPKRTLSVAALLIVGALALVPRVGFSLFPKAGTPQFLIDIETPVGSSLEATDRAARFAEQALLGHPNVRGIFTNVGMGNPLIYYNVVATPEAPNTAQLFVLTHHYDPTATPAMLDSLRVRLATYPGAHLEVREFENGPLIDAPIAVRIEGPNLDSLRAIAARVEDVMRRTPGTQYVKNPTALMRTDLAVAVNRQKAGLLGVPTSEIDRTVRMGVAGVEAGQFRASDGQEYPITVRVPRDGRPDTRLLDRIQVANVAGALVPLNLLAHLGFISSPTLITHRGQQRVATVMSAVKTGYNTDRVTKDVLRDLHTLKLPPGYRLTPAGEIEGRQESFAGIGNAIIIAFFGILAILVLEFRSFRATLIVASVIPLGIIGGIMALYLSGNTLSFMATIGFVALVGIEIKTSILLVDFTDDLRRQGNALDDAIQRAGEVRFVPIVLTACTAIGGLLPLALQGSGMYSPLAWVIIGGLLSSTLIARLVTPVLYRMLAPAIDAGHLAEVSA